MSLKGALQPGSLRVRLLALAALSIAATLTVAGLSLAYIFENHIERLVEQDLEARWLELAGAFALDRERGPILTKSLIDPRYQLPAGGAYWRVSEGGKPLLRSRSLWDQDFEPEPFLHLSPTGKAVERRGPNGSVLYVIEREVRIDSGSPPRVFDLAVGVDTSAVSKLRRSFAGQVVLALASIGVVLLFGAWLQASFGLRPLTRLREELTLLNRGLKTALTGRFPEEVAPLVDDLNRLLVRQENLIRRARERAGNLAHGLKTPLTILLGEAHRARARGDVATSEILCEQIELMKRHIDRELMRARTSGAIAAGSVLTDVQKTVDRLIDLIRRMPRGDDIAWENDLPDNLRFRMDPDDFGEIIGNLIDNARKWAKSRVRVSAEVRGEAVRFYVDDDGPGIPPEAREEIVKRGERAGEAEGTGLGLAIAMDVLNQYGQALEITDAPLGGCRVSFAMKGWIEAETRSAGSSRSGVARRSLGV
jgi:signal transduction histidine kinase